MAQHTQTKIVAIGGGHGLGRVLSALKEFGSNVTGIVTTTDNGGSTGRIRKCQGGIAWGDMRNCINQLITSPSPASMMFEYRFKGNGELNGHNLGNLMLTALNNLSVRPLEAIELIRTMLGVDVNILPMSEQPANLCALVMDGQIIHGETSVDEIDQELLRLDVIPEVPATEEAVQAIEQADVIIFGPGSFLTSVMPPLLLPEIGRAIAGNQTAKIIFIDNLADEHGPANLMTLNTRLAWCSRACRGRPIDLVIGTSSKECLPEHTQHIVTDLASSSQRWRHDRDKLRQILLQQISG